MQVSNSSYKSMARAHVRVEHAIFKLEKLKKGTQEIILKSHVYRCRKLKFENIVVAPWKWALVLVCTGIWGIVCKNFQIVV